jgi:hypothetical protein
VKLFWQPADTAEFLKTLEDAVTGVIPYSPVPDQAEQYLREFYSWPAGGSSAAYLIAKDLAALADEAKPLALAELHRKEYRVHPLIDRLARRTHLPRPIARRLLLRPLLFDLRRIYHAYKRGELQAFMRTEHFAWRRRDTRRVRRIFGRLRARDVIGARG